MRAEFNATIHAPIRLRACAMLAAVKELEFSLLRDELGVADSVLSKHLKVLAEEGYVSIRRPVGMGGRPKTWVSLTKAGREALKGHLAALQELARQAEGLDEPGPKR
ncbi:transcriptional regulator [Sinomonas sp. ASV322]|uniref:transcriptional regulator n=1 Tax=Sinomonas sp. ASV322 TaxID=3041920 RepID=UPI0027DDEB1A|nr:transcriptional regulator [Sinomonas sp. ASV322]MDQ4504199.1 transcriptional regulator [Sinomonas sp. ASV322]